MTGHIEQPADVLVKGQFRPERHGQCQRPGKDQSRRLQEPMPTAQPVPDEQVLGNILGGVDHPLRPHLAPTIGRHRDHPATGNPSIAPRVDGVDQVQLRADLLRQPFVVVVQQGDDGPAGGGDPGLPGDIAARARPGSDDPDQRVVGQFEVAGGIGGHDDLAHRFGLRQHRRDGGGQRRPADGRDHHRHRSGLPGAACRGSSTDRVQQVGRGDVGRHRVAPALLSGGWPARRPSVVRCRVQTCANAPTAASMASTAAQLTTV